MLEHARLGHLGLELDGLAALVEAGMRIRAGRATSIQMPGIERQPSSSVSVSSLAHSSTGFTSASTGPSGSVR